jgi:hypothetical protein
MPQIALKDTCVIDVVTSGFQRKKQKINRKYAPNASPYWDMPRRLDIAKKQLDMDFKGKRRLR